MNVGDKVVYMWLGIENTGIIEEIITRDRTKIIWVKSKQTNSKYPCIADSKFGYILKEKTEELQRGSYVKLEKTDIDYMMDDIEKSFNKLKELSDDNFPSKKSKEVKETIKNMKKQLSDLQKLIDTK